VLAVLTAALAVLAGGVLTAGPASAEVAQWSVAPSAGSEGQERANYGYVLDPGAVVSDVLVVTNLGGQPLDLGVYAADGFTTDTGQLDVLPGGQPSTDLGSWVAPATDRITVAPGERVEVPFTLTVPADATAGDHSGAIVTSLLTGAGDGGVAVDRRLGVRIHTLVFGDLVAGLAVDDLTVDYEGSAVPFAPGTAVVRFTLTNTGNTRVAADQVVRVRGPWGLGTVTLPTTRTPELLPGASLPVAVPVDGVPALVGLTADVALAPAAVGASGVPVDPVAASSQGTALSWPTLAVLVLLVAAVAVLRRLAARRASRHPSPLRSARALEGRS
jgi:hypothetical protein